MPFVMIEMYEGRSTEEKKKLVEEITSSFAKIGIPAEAVHIFLNEYPKYNVAHGGKLASET